MVARRYPANRDSKFVTTQPRNQRLLSAKSAFANQSDNPLAHGAQQSIADRVTMDIVDRFEMIEIEQHQRDLFILGPVCHQRRQFLIEQRAVGQSGQGIEVSHVLGPVLSLAADRDIGNDPAIGGLAAAVRGASADRPPARFVGANRIERQHHFAHRAPFGQGFGQFIARQIRGKQRCKRATFQRGHRFTSDGSEAGGNVGQPVFVVEFEQPVRTVFFIFVEQQFDRAGRFGQLAVGQDPGDEHIAGGERHPDKQAAGSQQHGNCPKRVKPAQLR